MSESSAWTAPRLPVKNAQFYSWEFKEDAEEGHALGWQTGSAQIIHLTKKKNSDELIWLHPENT